MQSVGQSLKRADFKTRRARRRFSWKQEAVLALLPTVTVLAVLALVEAFSQQRLLFASLASSAFLIYLDPLHGTNSVRTLLISQLGASILGYLAIQALGPGYWAAAAAMLFTIALMVLSDSVHPPAVSTALSFAFRGGADSNLVLFGLALGLVTILLVLERVSLWLLARFGTGENSTDAANDGSKRRAR